MDQILRLTTCDPAALTFNSRVTGSPGQAGFFRMEFREPGVRKREFVVTRARLRYDAMAYAHTRIFLCGGHDLRVGGANSGDFLRN